MDKPDEALYHYTQALLQSDTNIDAMIGIAMSTFDLERYDETVSWVDKILEIDPINSSAISIQVDLKSKNIIKPDINFTTTNLYGIAYSPYREGQSPIAGIYPVFDDIENVIRYLSSITDRIRIYELDGNNQRLYRGTLNEEQIILHLTTIREKLNPECLVTIAELSFTWLQHPKVISHVDYVMIHYYSYWGGIEISNATGKVFDAYYEVRDTFGKDVVIGETGWPSGGRNVNQAVPSSENQQQFVRVSGDCR